MKKQLNSFVLPLLICVLTPLGAVAELSIVVVESPGSGVPGDWLTFMVEVQENGNPASGQTVTFSITSGDGNLSFYDGLSTNTTGDDGRTGTILILGSDASGSYTVTASVGSVSTSVTATAKTPPPLSIVVVHSPGSGEPGDWLTFIVEVRENGRLASGKTVTFSITSGDGNLSFLGGSNTGTTSDNGRAAKTLVLGSDASGSYTVTASVGSVSVSRTATVDTPPPPPDGPVTRSMYRVESTPFHPGDTVTFVAEVRQTTGGVNRGVSGETITFSLSPDNGTASLSTTSGTTDSNGGVRTKLSLSSSASGSYYVTATYGDGTTKTHGTGTVYNPNKPRGFILAMRSTSGSIEPGEIKTFTAEIQKDGNWISGQTVAFSVSPDDGTVSLSTTSGTTDSNGRASTTLITGSNSSGTYTVTATLDNGQSISGTATVETSTAPPPSRTIVLSISDLGPLNTGDSVTFTALVREGGNRLSGQTVAFSVSPDDETTSLSTASATTDSNGNASTTLTLGSSASPGSYYVTATLDNGQSASNSTWIASELPPPPPPPELSIVVVHSPGSGAPGAWLTFIVEVQEDGSPASGKTVTFSITPDNGTLSFLGGTSTSTTGDNGRVAKTLVLGSDASGSYTVTASVDSVSVSRTATVETPPPGVDEPPTRTLYRVESIPFHPGDSVTFLASVRQVRGGVNRGVSGETVTFSLSPDDGTASLSTTSATTDGNGSARTTLTLGSSASGSYRVTATFGDGTSKTHSTGTVYNPSEDEEGEPPPPEPESNPDPTVGTSPPQDDSGEDQQGEEQPTSTVELDGISSSHDSVRENDAQATGITLTVTLDQAAGSGGEKVTLALVAPTKGKMAKRGEDFDATLEDTLTIATGRIEGTAQLILTPKDNTTADGDKAFAVEATSSSGYQALINIKIIDDEMAGEAVGQVDDGEGDDGEDDGGMAGEDDGEDNGMMGFAFVGEVENQVYTAGAAITALVLPEATGGEGEVSYRVFDLPTGLSFDAATRTISGTPTAATDGPVEVTCLAQDDVGAAALLTFSITVNPPLSFGN